MLRPASPLRAHLIAAAVLIAVALVLWAVIAFVPELALRLGAASGTLRPGVVGAEEGWVLGFTSAAMIGAAVVLAVALRQPVEAGRDRPWLIATAFPAAGLGVAGALAMSWAGGAVVSGSPAALPGAAPFLAGWLVVLWGAFAEELLFRGVLQPVLARAWGVPAALALQALVFTFGHYVGGWRDPLSLLNIFLAASWFGLLAQRTGGIAAPVLAHAAWNGVESLVFGASPNPGPASFGSLIDIDLVGPAMLGGTEDGLNASLTATLVLAALAAPLAITRRIGQGGGNRMGAGR